MARDVLLRTRNVSDKRCREDQKTFCVQWFFFRQSCHLCDNVENTVEPGRTQVVIWRMRIVCWMPKATNTHSEYVILIAFHCSNFCTNAPQCYVIRMLPDLLFDTRINMELKQTFFSLMFCVFSAQTAFLNYNCEVIAVPVFNLWTC